MKLSGYIGVFAMILTLCGCGKGDSGSGPPPEVPAPLAATLVFPENNTECNEGEVLSDTQSRVEFRWNASQNTDSYEIQLKNLDAGTTVKITASSDAAEVNLLRGVPYEWSVVSKANGTTATAQSETWKFYNEGPGIANYAPFPASAVFPARGVTIPVSETIVLEWAGSDVDNDLSEYEVFIGTDSDPTSLLGATEQNTLEAPITSATTYFWRVVSFDAIGNSSQSEIFEFRVE